MPNDDSLKRLLKLKNFFQSRERNELKSLATDCWVDAFVYEDELMLDTGLLAYCFSKLLDKRHIVESSEWKRFSRHALEELSTSISFLEKSDAGNNVENARELLHSLLQETESLSQVLGRFVRSVVEKARLKAAAEMYAHGASLGVASVFVNAPKREVADYIGGTKMQDKYAVMPVNERLKKIRSLFGGGVGK